jgi:hypothetical protein
MWKLMHQSDRVAHLVQDDRARSDGVSVVQDRDIQRRLRIGNVSDFRESEPTYDQQALSCVKEMRISASPEVTH